MSKFISSIQPFIFASQLLGFTLFTIDSEKWKSKMNFWSFLMVLKSIVANTIIHTIYWNALMNFNIQGTKMVQLFMPKILYFNLISYFFAQFWFFLNRNRAIKILKKFSEIDEIFSTLKINFDYRKQERAIIKLLLLCWLFLIVSPFSERACIKYYNLEVDEVVPFIFMYDGGCYLIISFHIGLGIFGIKQRFENLNEFIGENPHLVGVHLIRKLSRIHFMICKLIKAFNSVYGIANLIVNVQVFLWFCLFLFITGTSSSSIVQEYIFLFVHQTWMQVTLFGVYLNLFRLAENAKNEGEKTKESLYKILHKIDEKNLRGLIESFIYQIDNSPMEISSGFFELSWKFLFKVNFRNLNLF